MKVIIKESKEIASDEVVIYCYITDLRIIKIANYIKNLDLQINAKSEGEIYLVKPEEVCYIESIDKRTFIYLRDKVLECSLKLFELEDKFKDMSFFRASKSSIVNAKHIKKVLPLLNRNLLVTLDNDERVTISRRYVKEFNILIGLE